MHEIILLKRFWIKLCMQILSTKLLVR